jgi:hypothetical protein
MEDAATAVQASAGGLLADPYDERTTMNCFDSVIVLLHKPKVLH